MAEIYINAGSNDTLHIGSESFAGRQISVSGEPLEIFVRPIQNGCRPGIGWISSDGTTAYATAGELIRAAGLGEPDGAIWTESGTGSFFAVGSNVYKVRGHFNVSFASDDGNAIFYLTNLSASCYTTTISLSGGSYPYGGQTISPSLFLPGGLLEYEVEWSDSTPNTIGSIFIDSDVTVVELLP